MILDDTIGRIAQSQTVVNAFGQEKCSEGGWVAAIGKTQRDCRRATLKIRVVRKAQASIWPIAMAVGFYIRWVRLYRRRAAGC